MARCSFRLGLALAIATAALSASTAKAQSWSIARFADDPTALYEAALSVSPPAGTGVVVLDDEEGYVFDAQGSTVDTRYVVYRILTQNGVDGWDNVALTWEPWHENRPTIRARVITPDKVVHPLDPKTITDSPVSQDDDKVYSDRRVLRAPLPAIAPGSVVEVEQTIVETSPVFSDGVVTNYYFGRFVPVQHTRLTIDAPSSLPLQYVTQMLPDVQPVRTESNGEVHLVFEHDPMDALEEAEPNLPSDAPSYPQVIFSTGSSWHQVAQSYGAIVDHQIASPGVDSIVSGLIKGVNSRDDKAAAILQYLDRQVRYTGIEFGEASITPRTPAETLQRRFGDCKDKAALLVAMLRAAGIPAYVALLNAGDRQDVPADSPGMGLFDHAIVYVPGSPDLWIDATDEYARLGQLPGDDQGRLALIARDSTTALVSIPVSPSQVNLEHERREFYLAENGPARVVEISEPHGDIESSFRSSYSDLQDKDSKKQLTNYMKTEYLADSLDHEDRSDPDDLSRQFTLTLEADKAKRGDTDLDTAVAAIRFDSLFARLPNELQQKKPDADADSSAGTDKPKKPRTADWQLPEAFATEWDYKITPPPGFQPKALPPNAKISLGPATVSEEFSSDDDGIVHATIMFDTVKRRFTIAEADEMRNKVAEMRGGQPILIYFEPTAEALFDEGKVRDSFQAYRTLIADHPQDAAAHLLLAKALLDSGMGQAARDEANLAVKLEPQSAVAEDTLAEILEYDLVGRELRPGSDYAGAAAAFRAAQKLDPKDDKITAKLAILLEFNNMGLRYGPGAKLDEAIAEYAKLTDQQLTELGIQSNVAFALFYSGHFPEALKRAQNVNPRPTSMIAACEAAIDGSQAGLADLKKSTGSDDEFKQLANATGQMLANLRMYSLAADFEEAGASGDNASDAVSTAATYRKTQPREKIVFPDTPEGIAMRTYLLTVDPNLTVDELLSVASRNGKIAFAVANVVKAYVRSETRTLSGEARNGEFADIGLDMSVARAQPASQGDDSIGYKITLWPSASYKSSFYVVREAGQYKVLGSSRFPAAVALEVLDRVAANDVKGARALLDWLREDWHLAGGDDPLDGAAFPRIWSRGMDADAAKMRLAAASVMAFSIETAPQALAILEAARDSVSSEADKTNVLLALVEGYADMEENDKALPAVTELAKEHPESKNAFYSESMFLRALGRYKEADDLAQERLKRIPDDVDALRSLSLNAAFAGDYASAHDLGLKVINSEDADPEDYNELAWISLFTGKTDKDDVAYAIKGAQLSQNRANILHTLACLYGALGQTKQARDVLLQAMDALDLDAPEADYWYAFGRIADASGLTDIAAADYALVTKPKYADNIPESTYLLAQMRLKALGIPPSNSENAQTNPPKN
jgi:transglutaminase-like putative cysteine protease/tetratricopeptide (TPR) repeat protein